jgi:molybdopterin-containing oxidoreductase family membrane subunit
MPDEIAVQAQFDSMESLHKALVSLKNSEFKDYEAYGPVNLMELEDLMPENGSWIHAISTVGALIGLITFFLMCILSSLLYRLFTGGKPPISNVPFVIVGYEGTILISAIATFLGTIVLARLIPKALPASYHPGFSGSGFGITVNCQTSQLARVRDLFNNVGAVQINEFTK